MRTSDNIRAQASVAALQHQNQISVAALQNQQPKPVSLHSIPATQANVAALAANSDALHPEPRTVRFNAQI